MQKLFNQYNPGNPGHNEKTKSKVISIEESKNSQPKGPVNYKITEENFPNLNKERLMNIQEAYRITNTLG